LNAGENNGPHDEIENEKSVSHLAPAAFAAARHARFKITSNCVPFCDLHRVRSQVFCCGVDEQSAQKTSHIMTLIVV
jgi:hypothetical protein